jgi:glycosyltransferase involved in cell wall biosynthesis
VRILFLLSDSYLPENLGGMRISTHELCTGLSARGHSISVLCGLQGDGLFSVYALTKMKVNRALRGWKVERDRFLGYTVWRSWSPLLELAKVAAIERPDVVVAVGGDIAAKIAATRELLGAPLVAHVHDVSFHFGTAEAGQLAAVPVVANSHFTASRYQAAGIACSVIYPVLDAARYRVAGSRKSVLLGSPLPHKGGELALQLVRRFRSIRFVFATSCALRDAWGARLIREAAQLSNLKLVDPTFAMRSLYRDARVVLMPSQVEEGFGRIVAEGQVSGIPALASSRGALPEVVGGGGITLDPGCAIDEWGDGLQRLWEDETFYNRCSRAARDKSMEPARDYLNQVCAHERILAEATG